jgi:hypothetical protein
LWSVDHMWDRIEDRLALLELLATGNLHRRSSQIDAWTHLAELPWTRRSNRRDEIAMVEDRRLEVERLLTQVWPEWTHVRANLEAAGLPLNERGWRRFQDIERARAAMGMPPRLNRRTALAQVGPHSKACFSLVRRDALAGIDLTHDGTVRLRPSAGLRLRRGGQELDAAAIADVLGEVVLSERALVEGTTLCGERPRAVLLVENVGAYLDTPAPDGWLIVHVPGWDTAAARLLLDRLADVTILHFGDLDPNGVRIMRHLRIIRPDLRWVVPDFWRDYVANCGLPASWPPNLDLADTPPLVHELASRGLWLEQEAIVLDPRLREVLLGYAEAEQ